MTITQTTDTVLAVDGLRKIYNEGTEQANLAIDDVTFQVTKGEFVCIVGPSGAGKTTLLRCISGLAPASAGSVMFEGRSLTAVPDELGLVFQDYSRSLYPWFTNAKNIALPLAARRIPKAERAQRIQDALDSVGLSHVGKMYPWELSGGMQQRVAIARSLSYRPDLLLMDEPFSAVDAITRRNLQAELIRVWQASGAAVLFVTHDIEEAVFLADRVVVLGGHPAGVAGTHDIILPRPRDRAAAQFARHVAAVSEILEHA